MDGSKRHRADFPVAFPGEHLNPHELAGELISQIMKIDDSSVFQLSLNESSFELEGAILKSMLLALQVAPIGRQRTKQDGPGLRKRMTDLSAFLTVAAHDAATECRVCGCTDSDCSGCIERTGERCEWLEPNLCSACAMPLHQMKRVLADLNLEFGPRFGRSVRFEPNQEGGYWVIRIRFPSGQAFTAGNRKEAVAIINDFTAVSQG